MNKYYWQEFIKPTLVGAVLLIFAPVLIPLLLLFIVGTVFMEYVINA